MQPMRSLLILSLTLSLPSLVAQTFVVDAANGPGTNFTDLPTAVAAVPDGAVLLVRAGSYLGFSMSGMGLTVLGDPGAMMTGPIAIANTGPQQPVVLRQLTWGTGPRSGTTLLDLDHCVGAVLLEQLTQPAGFYTGFGGRGTAARYCDRLALRDCHILSQLQLSNSHTTIESCVIEGEAYTANPGSGSGGLDAISLEYGSLQIAGATSVRGGDGFIGGPAAYQPGNGIRIVNPGDLRVVGGSIRSGGGGFTSSPVFGSAIWAYGIWPPPRVSPRVTLFSATTYWPQVANDDVMPQLTGSGATPGGTLSATVETEAGDTVALVVGLPGPPATRPGILDPFLLDPTVHVFVAFGIQQAATPISASVAVPNLVGFTGTRLAWQAVCLGPATGLQVTNPVATLVH